jgi:hypothetical protein
MTPPWLEELRDILTLPTAADRAQALRTWEWHWLVELHSRQLISRAELETGRRDMLAHVADVVRCELGVGLAVLMVMITRSEPLETDRGTMQIRGDVMAIRREPKRND